MPQPRLSKTIADLQAKRGDASGPTPALANSATLVERFDSGAELPSTPITATVTRREKPENTRELSTSANSTSEISSPALTLPLSTLVQEYLLSSRPTPKLDLSSPGGGHLKRFSESFGGIPVEQALEIVVHWGYSFSPSWGGKTLEDLLIFHRDNCGFPKE